jgi:hypothetical protein
MIQCKPTAYQAQTVILKNGRGRINLSHDNLWIGVNVTKCQWLDAPPLCGNERSKENQEIDINHLPTYV